MTSKESRVDRVLQEVKVHTRLSAGVSKSCLVLDYGQRLKDHICAPIIDHGTDGVDQAINSMQNYSLLREDLDGLVEVTQWPDKANFRKAMDRKTKAAFTRKYNKMRAMMPYNIEKAFSKKKDGIKGGWDMRPEKEVFENDEDSENIEHDEVI